MYSDDSLPVFLNAKVRNFSKLFGKRRSVSAKSVEFYGSRVIGDLTTDSSDIHEDNILITRRSVCNEGVERVNN